MFQMGHVSKEPCIIFHQPEGHIPQGGWGDIPAGNFVQIMHLVDPRWLGGYSPHEPPFGVRSCEVVILHPVSFFPRQAGESAVRRREPWKSNLIEACGGFGGCKQENQEGR